MIKQYYKLVLNVSLSLDIYAVVLSWTIMCWMQLYKGCNPLKIIPETHLSLYTQEDSW